MKRLVILLAIVCWPAHASETLKWMIANPTAKDPATAFLDARDRAREKALEQEQLRLENQQLEETLKQRELQTLQAEAILRKAEAEAKLAETRAALLEAQLKQLIDSESKLSE